jgi:hypothetical protein
MQRKVYFVCLFVAYSRLSNFSVGQTGFLSSIQSYRSYPHLFDVWVHIRYCTEEFKGASVLPCLMLYCAGVYGSIRSPLFDVCVRIVEWILRGHRHGLNRTFFNLFCTF